MQENGGGGGGGDLRLFFAAALALINKLKERRKKGEMNGLILPCHRHIMLKKGGENGAKSWKIVLI